MPLAFLFAPITAATMVNVFMVALLWRDQQRERTTGHGLWWFWPIAIFYGLGLAAFAYFRAFEPITSGASVFPIAAGAELLSVGIVYALVQGFDFTRPKSAKDRALLISGSVFMVAVIVGAMFQVH